MKINLNKPASILALAIGVMAIYAGIKPLLGNSPGYNVLSWLPLYNYTMGILTVFITAILIWRSSRLAIPAAIATFTMHSLVMLLLQTAFRGVVATESLEAMTTRLIVWAVILGLMFTQWRKEQVALKTAWRGK